MNNKNTVPSLSSLSSARQSSPPNSLAQLGQNTQKHGTSLLASLASSSKPLSSLQTLAQRSNTNTEATPSLASLASSSKPLSSLQTLAQRSNTNTEATPSLASLAVKSSPTATASNSLAYLASRQSTPKTAVRVGASFAGLASRQPETKQTPIKSPVVVTSSSPTLEESSSSWGGDEEEESMFENPLCAKPSTAAQFLFKPQQALPFDAQTVFQKALKKSTSVHVFEFDQPSPDDIVIASQNQRSGKKS